MLGWNNAIWLVKTQIAVKNHMTSLYQSDHIIPAYHNYTTLKFVHDIYSPCRVVSDERNVHLSCKDKKNIGRSGYKIVSDILISSEVGKSSQVATTTGK